MKCPSTVIPPGIASCGSTPGTGGERRSASSMQAFRYVSDANASPWMPDDEVKVERTSAAALKRVRIVEQGED